MKAALQRNAKVAKQPASFALRPIAYGVMLACSSAAWANPTGPQVMHGAAQIQGLGSSQLKVTNTPGSIIHWQGFSIGAGQVTQFVQQSASSSVLNRVVGADISQIHGQLLSNGRVFLINPAGILIGAGAVIDTAGFVGSTLNMLDGDFLAGKLKFQGGEGAGSIVNQGWIKAGQGGNIVLVAPNIENSGIIQTEGGEIVLAAGHKMTIGSMELEGVQFEIQAPEDSVLNVGKLLADGGAVGVFAGTLKHSGDIRANALVRDEAGRIVLKGKEDVTLTAGSTVKADGKAGGTVTVQSTSGTTIVSGDISAKGSEGKGGDVRVLGDRVGIFDAAAVDTSGAAGGGQILVGGDYKGGNPDVQNAQATYFSPDATLEADAITAGDGGRVIVWADGSTRAHGSISVRGGAQSGNGGFVETSGHWLDVTTIPDVGALQGRSGMWLIDPGLVIIRQAGGDANMNAPTAPPNAFRDPIDENMPSFIQASNLGAYLSGTSSLEIRTTSQAGAQNPAGSGDIIFDASGGAIDITKSSATAGSSTLTLNADGNIRFIGGATTFQTPAGAAQTQTLTVAFNPAGSIITESGASTILASPNATVTAQVAAGKTWLNEGTINIGNNTRISLLEGPAATLSNLAAGVININAPVNPILSATNAGIFNNNGRVEVNTSATLQAAFGSSGIVNVNNAGTTLTLPNGQTIGGTIALNDATAAVTVSAGTGATFNSTTITGAGTVNVLAGPSVFPQATFTNVTAAAATLNVGQNGTAIFATTPSTFANVLVPFVGPTAGIQPTVLTANTGLTIGNNLTIGGGAGVGQVTTNSATFNGAVTVGNVVSLSAGTLGGTGALTGGTLTWTGGTIAGTGFKTFTNITSSNAISATTFTGNIGLNTGTWNNNGLITQDVDGRVTLSNNAVVNNTAGNNWTLAAGVTDPTPITGAGTFNNAGTFTSNGTFVHSITGLTFANTGQTTVNAGLLGLPAAAVADTGDITANGGGILAFNGARTLAAGADVTGNGTVRFSGGEVIVNSPFSISGTGLVVIDGGTATFNTTPGPVVFTNTLTQSAGVLQGTAGITTNGVFNWSGGTVTGSGALTTSAPSTVNITNAVTLDGRTWANNGTVVQTGDGKLTFANAAIVNNNNDWNLRTSETNPITGAGTFNNDGIFLNDLPVPAVTHTVSPTMFNNTNLVNVTQGTLVINANGTHTGNFDAGADGVIDFSGGTHNFNGGLLQGDGTIRFSGGASTVGAGGGFDDLVTLAIAGGTLTVNDGYTNVTNTNVSSGTLNLADAGGDADALTVSGSGIVNVNAALTVNQTLSVSGNGVLNANAPTTVQQAATVSGGTVGGTGALTLNGINNVFSGGNLTGTGLLTTGAASTTTISGSVNLTDKTWNNAGAVTLTGNSQIVLAGLGGTPVTFNNQAGAVFTDNSTNATPITIGSTPANKSFVNAGTFNKDAAAAQTINAPFDNTGTLNINTGTLTLSNGGTDTGTYDIDAGTTLLMSGGTRDLNAGIALLGAGTFQQSGGTLNINTPLVIANPGPTFAMSGGTLNGAAGVTLNGPFNWSGGTIQGAGLLTTSGTATTSITGNVILSDKTWNNAGAVTLTGNAQIALAGLGGTPVTFNNQLGAVFTDNSANATPITIGSTPANKSFVNAGTFNKDAVAAQTINAPFDNSGTVNVNAGTLTLSNDGADTGTYDIDAGTTLLMNAGTRDFNAGIALLGGGTFQQSGGTLNINTPFAIANPGPTFALSGGTLNGAADLTLNGPFNWSGGTIQGAGLLTTSGTATTSITGTANLTDKTWNNAGAVTLTGNSQIVLAGLGGTPVTFNNQAGAVFTDNSASASPITIGSTPANKSFVNAGTFDKNAAAAQTINAPFSNSGTVNLNTGTLTVSGNGTDTGTYGLDAGTTLQFMTGTRNLNAGASITGPGTATIDFAGGTVNLTTAFNQAVGAPKWLVRGSTISNTAGITLNDAFEWTGGTISGPGALTTSGTATTTIGGMAILDDTNWTNAGAVNLTAVQLVLGGAAATFTNNGVFTDTGGHTAPVTFTGGVANKSFVNAGMFNKNANTAQTISVAFSNTGTGTLNVNGGTLQLNNFPTNAGTLNLANTATLSTSGNDLASSGTIGGNGTVNVGTGVLTNSGRLRPGASPGTLNITGNLMMTGASITDIEIQGPGGIPGTDFDVINVTGQADLAGTLNVLHLGGFTPGAGESFTIINYGNHTGDFATKNFPVGYTYSTTANLTSYVLGVASFQNIWTFAGGGQWNDPTKWSLGRIPIASDDTVIPDRTGVVDTITVAAGTQSAAKLTASENVVITGGQLTLGAGPSATNANLDIGGGILIADGPLTANALSLTGGALQGTGAVTVANDFTFTGGVLANTAGVTVAGNTIVNAGAPQLNGLLSTAVLDVNGATLGIGTGGILTLTGAGASQIVNGAVNNIGMFRLNTPASNFVIGNAGRFNNDATGTFDLQNDLVIGGAGTGVFNNGGRFLKSGGTAAGSGGADTTLPFNNNGGQIDSQVGALRLSGGGRHTGQFRTAGNGVNLDGGTHVFEPLSSIEGVFVFLNGGATLDATGGPIINSALTWNGPGTITGGTLTVAPGGGLQIIGTGNHILDNVTVNNQGTTTYNAGGNLLFINNAARINNAGVFDIQSDILVGSTVAPGTFENAGTVMKSGGTGIGGFEAGVQVVSNGGTFNAPSGSLEFGGVNAFNDGTQFIGVGNNVVSGNSAFNGTITSNGLTLQNGTFSGNANLTGTTTWTGGTMTGAFTIPMGSVLNLEGASSKGITGNTLTNAGMLALMGTGNLVLNNGGVTNTGVLDIKSDADITQAAASTLANVGTLMKSGGAGTSSIGGPGFNMTNPGTLHVRSGTLEVNGLATNAGALTIDAGTTFSTAGNPLLNQGAVRGNGVLHLGGAALTNEALVAPGASPGTLLIDGDFVQTPAGVLAIELGGTHQGVTYDLLQITGDAVLDGILNVTNVGAFVPAAGDNFAFMTYNSHTGNFATFHFPVGTQLQASPGATAYTVNSQSAFNGASVATDPIAETRRLYDHFLEIIPQDAIEKPERAALICD